MRSGAGEFVIQGLIVTSRARGDRRKGLAALPASALILALAAGCTASGRPEAATITIDATKVLDATANAGPARSAIILATINGQMLRLKVDPGAPGLVLLNGSTAKKLALGDGEGGSYTVGPITLAGRTRFEAVEIDGKIADLPLLWFKHDVVEDADGVINIGHLPAARIVMQLRQPQPGEQLLRIPVAFDLERGLYHNGTLGTELIVTRFTLADRLTVATGATGSLMARRLGGHWQGEPFTHEVRYGVKRPVRIMQLDSPMPLNGLALRNITVRFRDDLGGHQLPQEAAFEEPDNSAIVVSGQRRRRVFGEAQYWLMVGSDDLKACSSLTYDNRRQTITLSCLPAK